MRHFLLISALVGGILLQFSSPARGQVQRPVTLIACWSLDAAMLAVERFVNNPSALGSLPQCNRVRPFYPTDIERETLVIGPLVDGDGDSFGVYQVELDDGRTVWAFTWFPKGFKPIGMKV